MKRVISVLLLMIIFSLSCKNILQESQIINPPSQNNISQKSENSPTQTKKEEIPDKKNHIPKIIPKNLDQTNHGWGLSVTTDETSPGIPESWKKMLNQYDGYYLGPTTTKSVYLTFDCGYEAGYTEEIIATLIKNKVPALFFITGYYCEKNPGIVKKMAENDIFLIGNHTYNHPNLPDISDEKIKSEILTLNQKIQEVTGDVPHYFRPPSGSFSEQSLAVIQSLGFKTIFWSLAFKDWVPLPGGPEESFQTVINRIHPGAVILLHAVSKDNRDALQRIIDGVRQKGYEFLPIDF